MSMVRPHEGEGNPNGRRSFRPFTDFKRKNPNGNGAGRNNNHHSNTRVAPPESTNAENF